MTNKSKQEQAMETIRREQLKDELRQLFDLTLDVRIDRYLEVNHQGIIGNHHFAATSTQCIDLYRDGQFISAVMVSQAVNEGIIKLIAERQNIGRATCAKGTKKLSDLVEEFLRKKIISSRCADASKRILRSFRNDVHHMNPKVTTIPFQTLAKRNLQDLAEIEKEIFGADFQDGRLFPHHPEYWDVKQNGTAEGYLRLE